VSSAATFLDLTPDDVPAGLRLCRLIGWNQTEADWRLLLAAPSVFRGARVDGVIVGTAGAMVYGDRLAWVCMVLVDPSHRGQQLASQLVDQVLERLPAGALVGLDATPKGQPVYERLGFRGDQTFVRLEATSTAGAAGPRPGVRALHESDLPQVLRRDREVFGEDRSRVLRGALAAAPDCAWCVSEGDVLVAYCFGRPGHDADQIGPVVADHARHALDLVTSALGARPGRRVFLDAAARTDWRQRLGGIGFREQRGFTRMYRGGRSIVPPGEEQCHAIFGPEFG
jgi:GNAT superfamily N-acetyltransferase